MTKDAELGDDTSLEKLMFLAVLTLADLLDHHEGGLTLLDIGRGVFIALWKSVYMYGPISPLEVMSAMSVLCWPEDEFAA